MEDIGLTLAKKPLQIKTLHSQYTPITIDATADALADCLKTQFEEPVTLVLWACQTVSFGSWDGSSLRLVKDGIEAEDIYELRAYNARAELHLLRSGNTLTGRLASDAEGSGQNVVDSFSRLWGTVAPKAAVPDGYTCLRDNARGIELIVPYNGPRARQLGLTTRSYIGYDKDTGLAGYSDYRFVSIDAAEEE